MYALIVNGTVVNVIVADADFINEYQHSYDQTVECNSNVGIGWTWNNVDGFAPPVIPVIETPPTKP
jgi:hypothetical protein